MAKDQKILKRTGKKVFTRHALGYAGHVKIKSVFLNQIGITVFKEY